MKYLKKAYARGDVELSEVSLAVLGYLKILEHCDSYYLQQAILDNFVLIKQQDTIARLVNENIEQKEVIKTLSQDLTLT